MLSESVNFAFGLFRRAQSQMRKLKYLYSGKLNLPNPNFVTVRQSKHRGLQQRAYQSNIAHCAHCIFFRRNFKDLKSLLYS